ncbi:polyadenylate binding protein [Laetiporus sulphureus 93-53]|uniref:Polyadenylate binding protein n=1 Tax=Laetiporus sulphureus 93-53 TaxID=1314785 RepID=A0A165F519_9APHY|nr:polyadenylate binding protein [Laetiporus sulphureus 93-53]KZT08407.1 polyadenylate binding protein [Laetiporus sulphureus 93-53]
MPVSPSVAQPQEAPVPQVSEAAPAPPPAPAAMPPAPAYNPAPPPQMSSPSASLYVGELDPTVNEVMLFEIFDLVGPVESIRVCRDAVTRRSLGYAYVTYLNAEDAERALEQLNYSLIRGRACRIMWSQSDPARGANHQGGVFIKNLHEQIDDKALRNTFAAFGNLLSCDISTDKHGRSKGYGFVHYETTEAAETTIKEVNGMLLNDKKVYVGHYKPRKERKFKLEEMKARFTNIYVKNIDTEMTEEKFFDLFKQFGNITSAVIQHDDEGNSRGFGFVNFETHEEAQQAVETLHDTVFNGKKLFVARAQKKDERETELHKSRKQAKMEKARKYQGVDLFTNIYVKNIDAETTEEEFLDLFKQFGDITSAVIQRDDEGNSRGFGFVNFKTHKQAQQTVDNLHDTVFNGKKLFVARAQKKEERETELLNDYVQAKMKKLSKYQGVNIYIKNLEHDIDDDKLRAEFEPFGTITSAKVMRDDKGTSKGFGFVCFSSPDEATKAVAEMNNKMIGSKPLYVSLAQPREVRRQQLESQITQRNQIRMQQAAASGLGGHMPPRFVEGSGDDDRFSKVESKSYNKALRRSAP